MRKVDGWDSVVEGLRISSLTLPHDQIASCRSETLANPNAVHGASFGKLLGAVKDRSKRRTAGEFHAEQAGPPHMKAQPRATLHSGGLEARSCAREWPNRTRWAICRDQ